MNKGPPPRGAHCPQSSSPACTPCGLAHPAHRESGGRGIKAGKVSLARRDVRVGCGVQPVCDWEPMGGRGARGEGGEGAVRCAGVWG